MAASPGVHAIVEVTIQCKSTDTPRDWMTNTVSFNSGAPTVTTAQWQALADAVKGVWFATSGSWVHYGNSFGGKVVCYDRADATPRAEKAVSIFTPGTWATTINFPRQIACCLSFYSLRNLKRQRGRVYLPPSNSMTVVDGIGTAQMNQFLGLGTQLATVAGALTPVWTHEVWSVAGDTDHPVSNYWVNDVWDTQRRREPKESTRVVHP